MAWLVTSYLLSLSMFFTLFSLYILSSFVIYDFRGFLTSIFDGNRNRAVYFREDRLTPGSSTAGPVPSQGTKESSKDAKRKSLDSTLFGFKGFTPTPKLNGDTSYDSKDYSDYLLSDNSSVLHNKPSQIVDKIFKSPRAKNCYESIKLGWKMGGAVGGIFGALTGIYAAARHRSLMIIPISMVGGAVSFGFFLGCGMVVRC